MAKYLVIESRDPFESNEVNSCYELAGGLAKQGHDVTLFLVQNGVLPARKGIKSKALADLAQNGVKLFADDFSLKERGIEAETLVQEVKQSPIDLIVDLLADGKTCAFWN